MLMVNKLVEVLTAPIRQFGVKMQQYKAEGRYLPIVGTFILSLGLFALMAFVAIVIILWLFEYFSNHIGLVVVIGLITWLYWAVLHKRPAPPQDNNHSSCPTNEEMLLIESAEAECDEMQITALMILQDVCPHINAKTPANLYDVIPPTGGRYKIKDGFCIYRYFVEKNEPKPLLTNEEKKATIALIQQSYNLHATRGKITGLTLKVYKDSNMALPPLKVHDLEDWGYGYLIEVVHTDAAYATYYYKAWHAQHGSAPENYDVDDINLL